MLIVSLVCIIIAFLWYFPIYHKVPKGERIPLFKIIKIILLGAVLAMIFILLTQIVLSRFLVKLELPTIANNFIEAFVIAALVEELIKYSIANNQVKKITPSKRIDYVLIFGAVGLGYQISESIMGILDLFGAILRGVFALHVIWQYYMGLHYGMYRQNGSKIEHFKSVFWPIMLHGTNDFLVFNISSSMSNNVGTIDDMGAIWVALLVVFYLILLIFTIVTMIKVNKLTKQS